MRSRTARVERRVELLELVGAADEWRLQPALECGRAVDELDQSPGLERPSTAELDGLDRLDLRRRGDETPRCVGEQDLAGRRTVLETLGRPPHVSCRDDGAFGGDRLARVDSNGCIEPQGLDRLPQVGRRAERAHGVVLVRVRNAEDADHRSVAGDLRQPAVTFDRGGSCRPDTAPDALGDLRIGLGEIASRGNACDEDGDHFPRLMGWHRSQSVPQAPRPLQPVGAGSGLPHGRCGQRLVLVEDRPVELLQGRARVDPELFDEPFAGVGVDGERLRLPAGAVERQHQLAVESLTERVRSRQHFQLGDERIVASAGEVGIDAVLRAREPELLEPGDLGLRERLVEEVGERSPAPEAERAVQGGSGALGIAGGELLPSPRGEAVELRQVQPAAGLEREHVSGRLAREDGGGFAPCPLRLEHLA